MKKVKKVKKVKEVYGHGQKPVSTRSGCKVYWETFATREEAEIASRWAFVQAQRRMAEGYDAGYCSPGSITPAEGGFEVCFL